MGNKTDIKPGEQDGVSTTIVGGQPPGRWRRSLRGVPVGVERVLFVAADDDLFRRQLLADPAAAIAARQLILRSSELAMLQAIPPAQLAATIDSLDTSPSNVERRTFMRVAAAGAMTIAAAGCSGSDSDDPPTSDMYPAPTGVRPDAIAPPPDAGADPAADAGADAEPTVDLSPTRGIQPDAT